METNYKTNVIDTGPYDVFAPRPPTSSFGDDAIPADEHFSTPVATSKKVKFFSYDCTARFDGVCTAGDVWLTTVAATTSGLKTQSNYRPVSITPGDGTSWEPTGVTVNHYKGVGYMMTQLTSIAGTFDVYSSGSATGPWTEIATGTLPGCSPLPPGGFCYALEGHPELSNSSEMEVTVSSPELRRGSE